MPYASITCSKDGSEQHLFYEEYGSGDPVILIHGWPLTHRAWESQLDALIESGHRVITYDRRGFGQSSKPYGGYDYDTLAGDLNSLITSLNLSNVTIVGFSMGGGEVARYIGKFGTKKLKSAVLISAVTPFIKKTSDNPQGVDAGIFEEMKAGVRKDRFDFIANWRENYMSYDANKDTVSEKYLDFLWLQASAALPKAMLDCITSFSNTDFRDDLKKCDVPLLVIHGTDDRICSAEVCGKRVPEFAPNAQLELIDGGPHGLTFTHSDQVNTLLTQFLAGETRAAA